ncbi:MAG: VOC family protein, partial [Asticcacaulis sp.]
MKTLICLIGAMLASSAMATEPVRPPITGVSHIGLYAADADKSERFYTHDLGATKGSDPENAYGVRYYFSPQQFVEILPLPAGTTKNRLDHIAFATADAEAMRTYLASHKIAVPAAVHKGADGS